MNSDEGPGRADDWRADRVGSALAGQNPTVLACLPSAFAVLGDVQFLPGYCVLLTDRPRGGPPVGSSSRRASHLPGSMDLLGEAVETVCGARDPGFRRVNLEILGNTDTFLHAHVWPRYEWESPELVTRPVWLHGATRWSDPATRLGPEHDDLRAELTGVLAALSDSWSTGPLDTPLSRLLGAACRRRAGRRRCRPATRTPRRSGSRAAR